ncbi:hypothetical protein IKD57_03715, partial [Candidatus Saccharibacteria bacterium]|nr:hypothetical protein [Candidatus Saccharibacteria bacterium]
NTEDKGFVYSPLFFVRGGSVSIHILSQVGYNGRYWSSTVHPDANARNLGFHSGGTATQGNNYRDLGFSLR